ncbi:pericentrin-like [Gossypium australe]|uniref:Pericentrin-like n=1 Tax=Gossypium australe TaxID=47621 RepID=A0A5B6X4R4_9ROSI|nr:pericentrin-like [Gossypium australe]
MKGRIEELESTLQSCELRVELLEVNEEHWKEQLHHSQSQVRDRDYIMGEAVAQIREVDDHLQALAIQADMLSVKYELESDRDNNKNQPIEHHYNTRAKSKVMDQRLERLEQMQKEMQDQLQAQLQKQLAKVQQDMRDQILESQISMVNQLTQLLVGEREKGKGPAVNSGDDNEDRTYPPRFTPVNV